MRNIFFNWQLHVALSVCQKSTRLRSRADTVLVCALASYTNWWNRQYGLRRPRSNRHGERHERPVRYQVPKGEASFGSTPCDRHLPRPPRMPPKSRSLTQWACADFMSVDERLKPKVVYWAAAYAKGLPASVVRHDPGRCTERDDPPNERRHLASGRVSARRSADRSSRRVQFETRSYTVKISQRECLRPL
jgi:hypothetical protein